MADDERLTFVLHGENNVVSVDDLLDAVRRITKLLKDVQYTANRGLKPRPWLVERLASSDPTITVRPSVPTPVRVVPIVMTALRVVEEGSASALLPPLFGEDALLDVQGIGKQLSRRGRLASITFSANGDSAAADRLQIDERIGPRVDRVLKSGYTEVGSIEGKLEAIQLHRGRWFTVWDDVTGAPVRCPISDRPEGRFWLETAKSALTKRVVVRGRIHYLGSGIPASIEPDSMVELTHDDVGPKATFGSIPDITGEGEDSVAYIRRMRGS